MSRTTDPLPVRPGARTHKLAPEEEQHRLKAGVLKTEKGELIHVKNLTYVVRTSPGVSHHVHPWGKQDKLSEGLIRFGRDSYHPLSDIEEVEDTCFIATAVYGDVNAPEVIALREFRDEVLAQSLVGRAVTAFYYSGFGRKAANALRGVPAAVPLVRKGLDYVVEKYSAGSR